MKGVKMYENNTMYLEDIKLCRNGKHRVNGRLERVIGYVQALADYYGYAAMLDKVLVMDDYKGDLMVTWQTEPTLCEMKIFKIAWESRIGDGGGGIKHRKDRRTL